MSNTNNMNLNIISQSDTIRDFMEKCNDNFSKLSTLSGPAGIQGEQGEQGVPTKPKVPIHAWIKGVEYINDDNYTLSVNGDELTDTKYQEGHLIILENAHVYVLEIENNSLTPRFKIALQSYKQGSVIDGKNAYVHLAYADDVNGTNMIIPNQNYQAANTGEESISTFGLTRTVSNNNSDISEKQYMGMYCSNSSEPSPNPDAYTWVRIRGRDGDVGPTGPQGPIGPEGPQGPEGSPFTGQNYTIDLQGDMAMVSLNIDRTIRNESSSCKCTIYAYYGDENVELNLNKDNVSFIVDENNYIDKNLNYKIVNDENNKLILWEASNGKLGEFTISQKNKDVDIEFKPEPTFIFPETTLIFPIQINSTIEDERDGKTYNFTRKTIWSIKGIVSNFSLEIVPQYRTIKLSDGKYTPDNLKVYVYKLEDGTRTLFDLNEEENQNYKLLYKNYDNTDDAQNWFLYNNGIIIDGSISCLEFRLVKNYDSTDVEKWEIWDYEDVWVVVDGIDGKDTHYYHADLGNTESMMVLTTGEKINISSDDNNPIYCAQLRDTSGYSITFNPKFYDGTEEYNSSNGYTIYINLGGEIGDYDGTFKYEWIDNAYTFTVESVPYGVDMIPITFDVTATKGDETYSDSIPFNIYISTITNIYTLVPSVSAFNTSTGIDGDVISCAVYKNNEEIETTELSNYGLYLKYKIYNSDEPKEEVYLEGGIEYGENGFTAENVGIEFILYYIEDPIVRSTVPLIKDGEDGEDGNNWQYIFCRLNEYPYPYQSDEGLNQNPSTWYENTDDNKPHTDPNEEYIHEDFDDIWSDDHQGVDKDHKYEYQSYRKWNKEGKYWGEYTSPTLYSNYSEDGRSGSGYSVLLSNPVAVIPVGDDWTADKEDSTIVYLYDNVSEIKDFVIDVDSDNGNDLNSKHFTPDKDVHKIIFRPTITIEGGESHTFNFDSNTPYKLPIKITYGGNSEDGDFTTTINWTLMPIKGLNDVEVFVDKRVVNISETKKHYFKVGYHLISSPTNDRTFVKNKFEDKKGYDIILTNDISNLSLNNIVDNWENCSYEFNETTKCFVVLVEKNENNTYNLIDSIDITPISDGKNGSSAIHLELTNDYIPVPCNSAGILHEQFTESISSQMILYDGDTPITSEATCKLIIDTDEYVNGSNGIQINTDGKFTIPNEFIKNKINGDTHITCTATYNNVPYYKTLFIDFELNPYELELNKQVLVRDVNNGNKITDTLSVRVKYWDNNSNPAAWVYVEGGKYENNEPINSVRIDDNIYFAYQSTDKCWTLNFSGNNTIDHTKDEFKISYYKNGKELSHEYIGVVESGRNGINGTTPTNTSVKVLGYSIKDKKTCEGAIDIDENLINANNSVWRPSISDWGSQVVPGQTIYILNEHTWVDKNGSPLPSTRSISTTMAGTQGADGKSRVLFYLGSFKDGTLKTTDEDGKEIKHYGYLTDTRCDYYIDVNDRAWMRIGQGEKISIKPDGNNYTWLDKQCWQESETVGFLQAGAIHANMINVDTLLLNNAFVDAIQTMTIYADEITGKTIKSDITISDKNSNLDDNDPTWQINNNGDGWLASKNISWSDSGDLTIGGTNNITTINGDLVINNTVEILENGVSTGKTNEKTSLVLCANHTYGNLFEDDVTAETGAISTFIVNPERTKKLDYINKTETKYITLSSGHAQKIYKWTLYNNENNSDGAPEHIFLKINLFENNKDFYFKKINEDDNGEHLEKSILKGANFDENELGIGVGKEENINADIYYLNEKNNYILFNKHSRLYSRRQYLFSYELILFTTYYHYYYIYDTVVIEINENKYTYINTNIAKGSPEIKEYSDYECDLELEHQIETANTLILSDGSIYTNSIYARDGYFYGKICSTGEFSGTISESFITKDSQIDCPIITGGTIADATITGGTIENTNITTSPITNSGISINDSNYAIELFEGDNKIPFFKLSPLKSNVCVQNYSYKAYEKTFSYTSSKTKVYYGDVKVLKNGIFASSGQTLTITGLELKVHAYQPNHNWFDNIAEDTLPVAEICWRYKGETNVKYICQLGHEKGYKDGSNDDGSNVDAKYIYNIKCSISSDNNKADFNCSGAKDTPFTYTITKPGEIEIIAVIQWASYADKRESSTVNFTFSSFNISLTNYTCMEIKSGSIIDINPNGLTITGNDGGKLTTDCGKYTYNNKEHDGGIALLSESNTYGLMVNDNGIFYRTPNSENWTILKS